MHRCSPLLGGASQQSLPPQTRCRTPAARSVKAALTRKLGVNAAVAEDARWLWTGSDEWSDLGDRQDAPPLPLPSISGPKRVVLVRHGQSTWNAEGRIQGSSDFSELTPKGISQAEMTRDMVRTRAASSPPATQLPKAVGVHQCGLLPATR